jgi:hypothetical protein
LHMSFLPCRKFDYLKVRNNQCSAFLATFISHPVIRVAFNCRLEERGCRYVS